MTSSKAASSFKLKGNTNPIKSYNAAEITSNYLVYPTQWAENFPSGALGVRREAFRKEAAFRSSVVSSNQLKRPFLRKLGSLWDHKGCMCHLHWHLPTSLCLHLLVYYAASKHSALCTTKMFAQRRHTLSINSKKTFVSASQTPTLIWVEGMDWYENTIYVPQYFLFFYLWNYISPNLSVHTIWQHSDCPNLYCHAKNK